MITTSLFCLVAVLSCLPTILSSLPIVEHSRILAFVLMYDMRRFNALTLILHEYRGMCEIGFDPVVVIQTTAVDFQRPDVYESLVKSNFCYRTGSPIKIRIQLEDKASAFTFHRRTEST